MEKKKILLILILALATFLRIWQLDKVPVSLFGDELDVGYQAYSILKTGKDYSGNFLPVHLQSLADYKSSLYAYLSIPTVALFGISPWGVRLPAAVLGVLGVWLFYLLVRQLVQKEAIALWGAFFLAVSPWHIQFSRPAFEAGVMLTLYLGGIYGFFKGLSIGKWLVVSAILLGFTTWAYHSAKVFLPITILLLLIIWRKELMNISRKYLLSAIMILTIIVLPIFLTTIFAEGANRFGSTSIFNDPAVILEVEAARLQDARVKGGKEININSLTNRIFHNKIISWSSILVNNYLQSFSTEFLFIKGDPNLRHSSLGMGEFYKFQFLLLVLGLVFFFLKFTDVKVKTFIISWLLLTPIPSAITRDGGTHAIRLLFLLPPLIFLISIGIHCSWQGLTGGFRKVFLIGVSGLFLASFIFYQHNYWIHYPWDSQKWWQAGFKEAIQVSVSEGKNYDKVIISQADEPALIFFLGWSQYPPAEFQQKYPLVKENLEGIGEVSRLDKYYFPPIGKERGLYELGSILSKNTLYLATAKEIKLDLIKEPQRVPSDLILIKSITYPSGDPAFYLFQKAI